MYNYEWFYNWLKNNFKKPERTDFNTHPDILAKNFSRAFFEVSEQDVISALKHLRFDYCYIGDEIVFSVDHSSPGYEVFKKYWS